MPDTISITSSARAATYWFIQPCMSVNFRCSSFSEVPPMPISLVTKIKVASCAVKRSNSAFTAASARSVSESQVEEKIGTPQGDAVYQDDPSLQPVAAEFFLLFDVCPFRSLGVSDAGLPSGGILRPKCVLWQDKQEWERARVPAFPHRCFCRNVLLR